MRHPQLGRRVALAAAVVIATLTVPALPAHATFRNDNGRIAFRRFLNEERTWGAVFTIKPNGRGERQITHPAPGFVDRNPDYSPDGRRIAFEREQIDCTDVCLNEVFVVNADGTGLRQLTHNARVRAVATVARAAGRRRGRRTAGRSPSSGRPGRSSTT